MHRREFLATTASPAFLGLEWGPLADNEGPETNNLEYDGSIPQFPDHITDVRDDIDELENYQPRLEIATQQARDDMQGMYGWSADSEDYDVTAHYYWVRSHTQRSLLWYAGLDGIGPEEHFYDHEPILVFQNPDGTVDTVVFSGGHHLAAEEDGEFGHLIEDRVADRRTHVVLRQMRPHNHFVPAESTTDGEWIQGHSEFGSWLDKRESWYRNGRYDKTSDVAVMDPFSFYESGGRTHWWREGTWDAWAAQNVYVRRLATPDTMRYEEV
ncbi:hypothetical protein Htur_5019 (plasmid) [Haloterrigena turkmenica DSM 5511]|uniref:Uncharacterized protein n=1 Tax=Haloterrigena turkmenica (strain ATCC 51198 / DSM 5511 / JCM 9101 / NCIMB 13204 / VKM B-1734 / 4k) TaxID=543526 RepID=D2S3G0_HALTV|nr:hypothetical protein [Haloterrigena turkmenica]ADB63907.1 hypothetical protein Htur_5019 [Haloterrigena turkmenica DSM 5511]